MSEKSPQPEKENKALEKAVHTEPSSEKKEAASTEETVKPAKKARASKSGKNAKKKTARKKDAEASAPKEQEESKPSQPEQQKQSGNQRDQNEKREQEDQHPPETARKQGRNRRSRGGRGNNRQDTAEEPKVKLDTKLVAKRAWKIFLGEVNEEGLALIADKDARELAKRSLRVAEIYSREEAVQLAKTRVNKKDKAPTKSEIQDKPAPVQQTTSEPTDEDQSEIA